MSLTALGLLITAAALHAGWNLLLKQAGHKQIATWWALVAGSLLFLPLLLVAPAAPLRVWPYAIASGFFDAAYFVILAAAYNTSDFSLVYPIARGTAPALLAVWAALFLHQYPRAGGLLGLAVLLLGLVVVGGSAWWAVDRPGLAGASGLGLALAVAFCISVYSAIDGAAVRIASPVAYTVLVFGMTAVFVTPVVYARYGWRALLAEGRGQWPRIGLVGCLTLVSYMLVLGAYARAPVSYAGAIREVSVVFGALAGWWWLGEGFGAVRIAGALLIFGGIFVIALAG